MPSPTRRRQAGINALPDSDPAAKRLLDKTFCPEGKTVKAPDESQGANLSPPWGFSSSALSTSMTRANR